MNLKPIIHLLFILSFASYRFYLLSLLFSFFFLNDEGLFAGKVAAGLTLRIPGSEIT